MHANLHYLHHAYYHPRIMSQVVVGALIGPISVGHIDSQLTPNL